MFPNTAMVRESQKELDDLIQQGVFQITRLLKNSESASSSNSTSDGDPYSIGQKQRSATFYRGKF